MQCLNFPCLLIVLALRLCCANEGHRVRRRGAVPVDDRYKSPKRDVDQSESREIGSFVPLF